MSDLSLADIQSIRLSRDDLEHLVSDLPSQAFDELVVGCLVRVLLEEGRNVHVYRVAYVKGVESSTTAYRFGANTYTSKMLVLDFILFRMSYQMNTISNKEFMENEFDEWVGFTASNAAYTLDREHVRKKKEALRLATERAPGSGRGARGHESRSAAIPLTTVSTHVESRASRSTAAPSFSPAFASLLQSFQAQNPSMTPAQKEMLADFGVSVEQYLVKMKEKLANDVRRAKASKVSSPVSASPADGPASGNAPIPVDTAETARVMITGKLEEKDEKELKELLVQCDGVKAKLREHIGRRLNCVVCMEVHACVILLPCKHQVLCEGCSTGLNDCPTCRKPITSRFTSRAGV